MSDQGVIASKVIIDVAQATQQIQQLQNQIRELKAAYVSASTSETKSTMFQGNIVGAQELQGNITKVTSEMNKLSSAMSSQNTFTGYKDQLRESANNAERLHQAMRENNNETTRMNFSTAVADFKALSKTSDEFHSSLARAGSRLNELGSFGQKLKSHLWWMLSGSLLAATFALPAEIVSNIVKLEEAMAGVRQVLPQIEHDQAAVNKEAKEFIGIAQQYGAVTLEVVDAGRSWARMYKDIDTVNALTSITTKIAVADNISLADALKGAESAMAQFGMRSENYADNVNNANRVADVMTKVAHTGAASAADLSNAIQRAGSSAHQAGVSFEFFNALVATGVRNTARSGSEIGQSLKSLFTSIHSTKAIAEIENLGISVYKFSEDGTKSFRSVQDVILDLSLAIQNTEKDTSKLELALGGGKWQVSKVTAIMTDYQEIIKMWKNAVDSSGFTNEQVAIQLDTIARKFQTTKALFDGVVAGVANAGLGLFIKEQVESINNFLRGLTSISSTVYQNIATTARWSVELYVAYNAMKWLIGGTTLLSTAINANSVSKRINTKATVEDAMAESMGMRAKAGSTVATGVNTVATNVNTTAKTAATIATTALTRAQAIGAAVMGNIVPLLIVAGAAAYSYSESVGKANNKTAKLAQAEEARIETMNRTMESTKQESEFVTKVSDAYDKQAEELAKVGEASEKGKKIKDELIYLEAAITDELYKNTGVSAENREAVVSDGKINRDVIEKNLKAKEIHSQELAKALIQDSVNLQADADNNRVWANSKLDNMEKEIQGLGFLQQAWLRYLNFMSSVYGKLADNGEQYLVKMKETNTYGFAQASPEMIAIQEATIAQNRANSEGYKDARVQSYGEYTGAIQALKNSEDGARLSRQIRTGYQAPKGIHEDAEVSDGDGQKGKDASNGGTPPSDVGNKVLKDSYKMTQDAKFLSAKLSADRYAESLDALSTKESIYGTTVSSTVESTTLKTQRIAELAKEEQDYNAQAQSLDELLNNQIGDNGELQTVLGMTKESWDALTKAEKANYKLDRREFLEQHELTKAQTTAMHKYQEEASKVHKEIVKTTDELLKQKYAGLYDESKISQRNLKNIGTDEETAKSLINSKNPMRSFDAIEATYNAEKRRNDQYIKDQQRLTKALEDANVAAVKSAEAEVRAAEKLPESAEKVKALADAYESLKIAQEGNTALQREASDAVKENTKNTAVSNAKLEETKDKFKEIKDAWASNVADMIVDGKNGGDILKGLFKDLAREAIMRMMGVQGESKSLIAQSAGKGKGTTGTTGGKGAGKGKAAHADGGVFTTPHIAQIAEDGDEAIVNLDRLRKGDASQAEILRYANSQVFKGDSYEPTLKNPELAKTATQNFQLQRDNEHIAAISRTNELLIQQNQLIIASLNKQGNNGGTTIIAPTVSDDAVLSALARNPRALQGINAKNNSGGFK